MAKAAQKEVTIPLPVVPVGPAQRAVKIKTDSYQLLLGLVGQIEARGWACVGSPRKGAITQGAVIDHALRLLAQKIKS